MSAMPPGGYQWQYGPPPKKPRALPWVLAGLGLVVVLVLIGGFLWPGWFKSADEGTSSNDADGVTTVHHSVVMTTQVPAGPSRSPELQFLDGYADAVDHGGAPTDYFCADATPSVAQVTRAVQAGGGIVPHSPDPAQRGIEPGYTVTAFAVLSDTGNIEYLVLLDDVGSAADPAWCIHDIRLAPAD